MRCPRAIACLAILILILILTVAVPCADSAGVRRVSPLKTMVEIPGGTFRMGDVYGDGASNERPVHEVTLGSFCLARTEVTVGEFRAFVLERGFATSAETFRDREAQERRLARIRAIFVEEQRLDDETMSLIEELGAGGGCHCWMPDNRRWDFGLDINWRNPGFEQNDSHPVVGLSWVDAASYCNWLSEQSGLPVAYDVATGTLLDRKGLPTDDLREVTGYRLPSEAEWEFAARERGRKVRFGNGKDIARASEINFDVGTTDSADLEVGRSRKGTVPVGSFRPNALGLHEMSGNAWEWCSDSYRPYSIEPEVNPHQSFRRVHALRGGRWGGGAEEARVFHRSAYKADNRCNNSGFRIARSSLRVIRRYF